MLPSRFPNLLVNGSSGIAVGMATNIPPHNLKGGHRPPPFGCWTTRSVTLSDLMEHIKGPDFPTHGIIMGSVRHSGGLCHRPGPGGDPGPA